MSQANVYTTVANAVWYTDKCEIVTGAAVTYNIYVMQAGIQKVGIVGDVTNSSNIMITTNASQELIGATFVTGAGVANTTTVTDAVNGKTLTMSANASASFQQSQYTLTTGNQGNLYNAAPQVAANSRQQIYVGAGNKLTITGTGYTAREIGTASSAVAGH